MENYLSEIEQGWREDLRFAAEKSGVSLFRFSEEEWSQLRQSRAGGREFTIARRHENFSGIKSRSLCLVVGREENASFKLYIGVISSKQPITTLDTRIKVRRLQPISPNTATEFAKVTGIEDQASQVSTTVSKISKKRGGSVIYALSAFPENEESFHSVLDAVRDVDPRAKIGLYSRMHYKRFSESLI